MAGLQISQPYPYWVCTSLLLVVMTPAYPKAPFAVVFMPPYQRNEYTNQQQATDMFIFDRMDSCIKSVTSPLQELAADTITALLAKKKENPIPAQTTTPKRPLQRSGLLPLAVQPSHQRRKYQAISTVQGWACCIKSTNKGTATADPVQCLSSHSGVRTSVEQTICLPTLRHVRTSKVLENDVLMSMATAKSKTKPPSSPPTE